MENIFDKTMKKSLYLRALIPGLSLIGVWLFFMRNALSSERSFVTGEDTLYFLGPVLASMSQGFVDQEWPLRISELLGGVPLYNFSQLTAYYPFYFWFLPLFDDPIETMQTLHWLTVGHVFVFQCTSYIFLRSCKLPVFSSLIGASLIAFSANSFSYHQWINITAPYAWLPLYLSGLLGICQGEDTKKNFFVALTGIVLLTVASPAQPLIHAIFITIIITGVCCWRKFSQEGFRVLYQPIWQLSLLVVTVVLLLSPVLLPTVLEYKNMIRWLGPFGAVSNGESIPFEAFLFDQLSISDFVSVLFPASSPQVGSQFVGVVTFTLSCFAIASRQRHWVVNALIIIAVYSLLSAAGSNLGLAYINHEIPFVNKIREPSRFLILFQFAMGALAAFGICRLSTLLTLKNYRLTLIVLCFSLLVSIGALMSLPDTIKISFFMWASIAVLTALLASTILAIYISSPWFRKAQVLLWGISALIILSERVSWPPKLIADSNYGRSEVVGLSSVLDQISSFRDIEQYRVVFGGNVHEQFAAMLAVYYEIRTLNTYFNPLPFEQFSQLYYHGWTPGNYLRVLGVKYLVCDVCTEYSNSHLELIGQNSGYRIYELEDALPRLYTANSVTGEYSNFGDFQTQITRSHSKVLSPPLYVRSVDSSDLKSELSDGTQGCSLSEKFYKANFIEIRATCPDSSMLVISEYFDGNWQATVDNESARIFQVNGNQLGVILAEGTQLIKLQYRPRNVSLGAGLSFLGIMLLGVILLRRQNEKYIVSDSSSGHSPSR